MEHISLKSKEAEELRTIIKPFKEEAVSGNTEMFRKMAEAESFKLGEQWSSEDRGYNESKGKHSLTINQILPLVNSLVGEQTQNPSDLTCFPLRSGNKTRARLLSALLKQAMDDADAGKKGSSSFDDGTTTGRGFLFIDYDYTLDPEKGNLTIKTLDPFDVFPEPDYKHYDYNHPDRRMRYVFYDEWVDKDIIHLQYPDFKKEVDGNVSGKGVFGQFVDSMTNFLYGADTVWQSRDRFRTSSAKESDRASNKGRYNYRVTTCMLTQYVKGAWLVRADNPLDKIPLYDSKSIARAKDIIAQLGGEATGYLIEQDRRGLQIVLPRLIKIVIIDDIFVDIIKDPFDGINALQVARYAPYFTHGHEMGIVENLISPQQVVNYGWSQMLNIIKKLANTGYVVGGGSDASLEWLEEHGTEDGIVIDKSKFKGFIEKMKQNDYPSGFDMLTGRAIQHIADVSGIRRERPSFDDKNMSGRAIALKQQAAETGNNPVMDKWNWTQELFGKLLLEHVMKGDLYSKDEILAIVDQEELIDEDLLNQAREIIMAKMTTSGHKIESPEPPDPYLMASLPVEVQNEFVRKYQEHKKAFNEVMGQVDGIAVEMAQSMLLDDINEFVKYGRYGLKVALSKRSLTYRQSKRIELFELDTVLLNGGREPLPRDILIKSVDPPYKEEILNAQPQQSVGVA